MGAENRFGWRQSTAAMGLAFIVWGATVVSAWGQNRPDPPLSKLLDERPIDQRGELPPDSEKPMVGQDVDTQRRQEAMAFVERHQPQIKNLLRLLEKNRPAQFQKALRSLVREVERLQAIEKRDPARFELALAIWKNQKTTDLLIAQAAVRSDDERLRQRVRQMMMDLNALQIKMVEFDTANLRKRLADLDADKTRLQKIEDSEVERRMEQRINAARRLREATPRGKSTTDK